MENLKATVDSHKPCVTLKWDPPANAGYPGDVTKYQVRFWNKEKSCYSEEIVNGSRTTTIITRESGLRPLFDTTFAVRACSGDDVSQEWRTATIFVGMHYFIVHVHIITTTYVTPNHIINMHTLHKYVWYSKAVPLGKTLGTWLFKVLYRVDEVIILSFLGNLCKSSRNLKQVSLLVRDHINGICTFSK